jgi:Bifunctional DNA primase/polymerase, N-terminal
MSPTADDALAAALALGLPVFPCRISKTPACPNGYRDAVIDGEEIRQLWDHHPGVLVGVPTGPASGFDALDVDPRHAGEEWLVQYRHRLPITRTHCTRSGGWHLLFACHPGLRNSVGRIAPGIDVRATGGYVVWWPAFGMLVTAEAALAPWPRWILDKLMRRPARLSIERPPPIHLESRHVAAAIAAGAAAVRRAAVGTRNHTLNRECFALARFVADGAITAQDLAVELASAAAVAGLHEREIVSTSASAFRARGVR